MSSSREKGHISRGLTSHRRPSSRMRRNNPTKEVSGGPHMWSALHHRATEVWLCQTLWGQSVLGQAFPTQVILEAPCHTKITGREQVEGKARGRTQLEFCPTCSGGDTDSNNKLSDEAVGSLGQGMSTKIHCLPCLTSALPLSPRKCSVLPRAPEGVREHMF